MAVPGCFKHTVYLSKDNTIVRAIIQNGVPITLNVTSVRLNFKRSGLATIVVDSATAGNAGFFDFTKQKTVQGKLVTVLTIIPFGMGAALPTGVTAAEYDMEIELVDAVNTNGLVWDVVPVEVLA